MSAKLFCPFSNVGFCKFKDNCSKEHANGDCEDIQCKNKKCTKRHRRLFRYENKCSHFRRKVCEFKQNSDNSLLLETQLQKVQVEAVQNQDECEKLKAEIKSLHETIKMQKVKLANFEDEKTVTSIASIKEIDLLKITI